MADHTSIGASIRSIVDDPLNPFYLHHSDSPGHMLVSQMLTGDNYASWSRAMTIALSVKNKLGFIDASIQKPASNSDQLTAWIRNNNMVISWILNSVSKDISASIIFGESARDIWLDLQDRFQQSNGPRIFQLRRELINHSQGQNSVSVYFTKLKTIWEELNNYRPQCACGKCCDGIRKLEACHQMDYVMTFLMGLNESYASVRSQILLLDPLPLINKVFAMIIQEERQRTIGSQTTNPISSNELAFAVNNANNRSDHNSRGLANTRGAFYSRGANRGASTTNRFSNKPRDRPFCTVCQMHGHTIDTCYKIHGYPPGYQPRPKPSPISQPAVVNQISNQSLPPAASVKTSNANHNSTSSAPNNFFNSLDKTQYDQLMSLFASHLSVMDQSTVSSDDPGASHSTGTCLSTFAPHSLIPSRCWIVDSGASRHICSNIGAFISMRPIRNSVVTLPNNSRIVVKFCGTVRLNLQLVLTDVLFVPEFKFNLFSVSSFVTNSDVFISFFHDHFIIQDNHLKTMIGKDRKVNNLYVFDDGFDALGSKEFYANHVSVSMWHNRLGHPSLKVLESLKGQIKCSKFDSFTFEPCYICPLAKQKRLPFISNHHMSPFPFDLVHCDIWGPYNTSTLHDQRFFLTIVDDCTRFTWVFLIRHKSEASSIVSKFYALVETQFQCHIKAIRTDHAKELAFTDFCAQKGILHQLSCVQRPEQNSVVERKHQHLLNVARSLYFQSRVPIHFWGECILTATFLINRIPSPWLQNKSPFELLYQRSFEYETLKVFGCLGFVSTLPAHRAKFQPRARLCVFIGYPSGMKGYKMYDIHTHEIFVSRDVFYENIFPFHSLVQSPHMLDSFPDLVLPNPATDPVSPPAIIPESQPVISPPAVIPESQPIIPSNSGRYSLPGVPISVRTSSRTSHPPSYLRDYHCNLLHSKPLPSSIVLYPLNNYLSYDSLSPSYKHFVLQVSSHYEPTYYHEAIPFPHWRQAMHEELTAMEDNHTWSIVSLPLGKHSIGCRWVYKTKFASNGSVDRHKARLVAKGYTQQEGVDFFDTFSPVAKLSTVKILLALAAINKWHLFQLDINNAFLNGDLLEEVYMDLPLGYHSPVVSVSSAAPLVCKLHKSIYGLKQASRQWYSKFSQSLLAFGFTQSKSDYTLFTKGVGSSFLALLVYVDDIVIAGFLSRLLIL